MDLSLRQLEQAVSLRRQIDALERRFAGLVGGARAKIAAAARARWARVRGGRKAGGGGKKSPRRGRMSAATRKKLSDMMKARWAARRRSGK